MVRPKKARPNCRFCGESLNRVRQTYCNNACQARWQHSQYIERWKLGLETGIVGNSGETSDYIRQYFFDKYNNKCSICKWGEVNKYTGNVPLTLEHIDGNSSNNVESNLTLLCPNCHSLTATYGNLNKGKGRASRRKQNKGSWLNGTATALQAVI